MGYRRSYTEKFDDEWYLRLTNDQRAVLDFLIHKCDCAGFWEVSDVLLGRDTNMSAKDARKVLETLVEPYEGVAKLFLRVREGLGEGTGKKEVVWLKNFVKVQNNTTDLRGTSNWYKGVKRRLKENLSLFPEIATLYEGLSNGSEGLGNPPDGGRDGGRDGSSSLSREGESEGEISRKTEKGGGPKKSAYPGKGHDELYDRILDEPGLRLTWEAYSGLRKETPDVDWAGLVDYMLMLHVNDGSGGIRNAWAWLAKQVREPKWTKANRRKDVPNVQTREEYENEVI